MAAVFGSESSSKTSSTQVGASDQAVIIGLAGKGNTYVAPNSVYGSDNNFGIKLSGNSVLNYGASQEELNNLAIQFRAVQESANRASSDNLRAALDAQSQTQATNAALATGTELPQQNKTLFYLTLASIALTFFALFRQRGHA